MTTNAKKQTKPFIVDFMRKKSIYSTRDDDNLLVLETSLMQSKDGVFEHIISVYPCDKIRNDVDRVACITGTEGWFSPVDSILEFFFMTVKKFLLIMLDIRFHFCPLELYLFYRTSSLQRCNGSAITHFKITAQNIEIV